MARQAVTRSLVAAVAALLVLAGRPASPSRSEPEVEPPAGSYAEAIDVALLTVVVRVVDDWGNPILGLGPEDFRVRAGDREGRVLAVDWVGAGGGNEPGEEVAPAGDAAAAEASPEAGASPLDTPAAPPPAALLGGRLLVVFVQADLHPSRIGGQLRLRPYTRELLASLQPRDRVAVVSFDSHLKLWLDFTANAEAIHAAIDRAMLFSREVEVPPSAPLSLVRHVDRTAAYYAGTAERALELIGDAMAELPGEKELVFLGWGLGRYGADGVRMIPAFAPAVRALRNARATVFALDVTTADSHSLAVGLESVAAETGGAYLSTFRQPGVATRSLGRMLAGHYLLTVDRSAFAGSDGRRLRVRLRGRHGTVLVRPVAAR